MQEALMLGPWERAVKILNIEDQQSRMSKKKPKKKKKKTVIQGMVAPLPKKKWMGKEIIKGRVAKQGREAAIMLMSSRNKKNRYPHKGEVRSLSPILESSEQADAYFMTNPSIFESYNAPINSSIESKEAFSKSGRKSKEPKEEKSQP